MSLAKQAICGLLGVSSAFIACSDASKDGTSAVPAMIITYVPYDNHRRTDRVLEYSTQTGETLSIEQYYWGQSPTHLCGDDEDTPPDHRFYGVDIDLDRLSCPELQALVAHLEINTKDITVSRPTCHQGRGLIAIELYLMKRFPGPKRPNKDGKIVQEEFQTSVCQAMVIYDANRDSLVLVDSIENHHFSRQDDYYDGLSGDAFFDQSGEHLYYEKRIAKKEQLWVYDVATKKNHPIVGYSSAAIPFNGPGVLAYSHDNGSLDLLDRNGQAVARISTKLDDGVFSCCAVDSLTFVIGSRESAFLAKWAYMLVSLYDFRSSKRTELFTEEPGQIVGVKVLD